MQTYDCRACGASFSVPERRAGHYLEVHSGVGGWSEIPIGWRILQVGKYSYECLGSACVIALFASPITGLLGLWVASAAAGADTPSDTGGPLLVALLAALSLVPILYIKDFLFDPAAFERQVGYPRAVVLPSGGGGTGALGSIAGILASFVVAACWLVIGVLALAVLAGVLAVIIGLWTGLALVVFALSPGDG